MLKLDIFKKKFGLIIMRLILRLVVIHQTLRLNIKGVFSFFKSMGSFFIFKDF